MKQVDYTVKWDDVSNSEDVSKILKSYNQWYSVTDPILGKKRTLDGKELTIELFKELWKWHRLYQVVYADEHGELPTLEKMEELADKALMPKKK